VKKGDLMIQLRKINKEYQVGSNSVHALKDVDLDINENDFIAVMGTSGSGKSTLMNILGCLDKADSGTYNFENEEIAGLDDNDLAAIRNRKIGFVFQSFNLLPNISLLKNVELPMLYNGVHSKDRKEKALGKLKMLGLENRVDHKPTEISGGQKQRVAIARALVNDPAIILADEPTGNLDSKTSKEILNIFIDLHKQGKTIILVTHEQEIGEIAERLIVFKDGQIVSDERK
jgi:putative ABC transport system ATP-binding protein